MDHDEMKNLINKASKVAFEKQKPYLDKIEKQSLTDLKSADSKNTSEAIANVIQSSELLAIEVSARMANQTLIEVLDQLDLKRKGS